MALDLKQLGIKPKKTTNNQRATDGIILCRVSSKEQEDNNSLPAQRNRLLEYCKRKDLKVIGTYSFTESSTRGDRPKFRKMIKEIEARKAPVAIVCDKVDRLQRSFKDVPILEKLRLSGKAELHFSHDNIVLDANSRSNEIMHYNMLVMFAQNYTDSISDNVNRAYEKMVQEGRALGLAPLGYLNVRNEQGVANIIVDESRAQKIKTLFQDYATGLYSMNDLVQRAKDLGLDNKGVAHKPICKRQIEMMIKNPFYCGYASRKGEIYQHIYPKIISEELFIKCNQVRQSKKKQPSRRMKHNTVFQGLIKCTHCGCTVTPDVKKDKYVYLKPNSKKGCNCKQINEEVANKLVEDVFKDMFLPKDVLIPYISKLEKHFKASNDVIMQERVNIGKKITIVKNRLERLQDLYIDGGLTKDEYTNKKTSMEFELSQLKKKFENLPAETQQVQINLQYLQALVSRVNELYQSSRIDEKRRILKLVFSNFFLDGSNLSYEMRKPFDMFVKGSYRLLNWA